MRQQSEAAIRHYRLHGDIKRVISEAGNPISEPLRMASYLLGHLDGLNLTLDQTPAAKDAIANSPYAVLIDRQADILRGLWEQRGKWHSIDALQPLHQICIDALAAGGLFFHKLPDGQCHVDIPMTANTIASEDASEGQARER